MAAAPTLTPRETFALEIRFVASGTIIIADYPANSPAMAPAARPETPRAVEAALTARTELTTLLVATVKMKPTSGSSRMRYAAFEMRSIARKT